MAYYYEKEEKIIKRIKEIENEIYCLIEVSKHPELFEFKKEESDENVDGES